MSIIITATYVGFRTTQHPIQLNGKQQWVMDTIYQWNDIRNEKGEILFLALEVNSKSEKYLNLIKFAKYKIVCSEVNQKTILRASKVELIPERVDTIPEIHEITKFFSSDIDTEEVYRGKLEPYSKSNLLDYLIYVIKLKKQVRI